MQAEGRYEAAMKQPPMDEAEERMKVLRTYLLDGVGYLPNFIHLQKPQQKAVDRLTTDMSSKLPDSLSQDIRHTIEVYRAAYVERAKLSLDITKSAQRVREAYTSPSSSYLDPGKEIRAALEASAEVFEKKELLDKQLETALRQWVALLQKSVSADQIQSILKQADAAVKKENSATSAK
jgi:hypothetical protein